ncbi:MAG: hypothetical protein IJC84_03545 [Clostridia bacterium]|nr:hypothetical protein [Clostridia bacterium]
MKIPKIARALSHVDDDLVLAAAEAQKKTAPTPRFKWLPMAACLAALLLVGGAMLPLFHEVPVAPAESTREDGRYKEYSVAAEGLAVVWPWEYQTLPEKYIQTEINGTEYIGKGRAVSAERVGELVGTYTVAGFDLKEDRQKHTAQFEVYEICDVAQSQFVAVKMEEDYYVFRKSDYEPPATLGQLMAEVDLPSVITLSHFSENGDGPESPHYTLSADNYIWEVLKECEGAPFREENTVENESLSDRTPVDYLSFTVSSDALGLYKVALRITEDGYLWTNAFSYQYLFDIGEEAAGKILQYARKNSVKAEYEPYQKTLAGTVKEITRDSLLLDDSVLCKDPEKGVCYKIMLDPRLSRYVESGLVRVGDTVQISYEGEPDGLTVYGAFSAAKVTVIDGAALSPG